MKNILLLTFCLPSILLAQTQFENPGFETWEGSGSSAEPTEWSSIKTSDVSSLNTLAPQVLFQSTDAHSGSYSIKLENKSSFGVIANGIVTNGQVHADLNPSNGYVFTNTADSKWNTPFTDKPDSIVGWYKYAPSGIDKGKVEVILHTGAGQNPENGTLANRVGGARFNIPNTTISSWTRFSAPFYYSSANTPQYMLAVLTTGDSTNNAQAGSIGYFDDLEFIYNPTSVEEHIFSVAQIFQHNGLLTINMRGDYENGAFVSVSDIQGRTIITNTILIQGQNTFVTPFSSGIYLITFIYNNQLVTRKIFID
jgi:hypothetical protein